MWKVPRRLVALSRNHTIISCYLFTDVVDRLVTLPHNASIFFYLTKIKYFQKYLLPCLVNTSITNNTKNRLYFTTERSRSFYCYSRYLVSKLKQTINAKPVLSAWSFRKLFPQPLNKYIATRPSHPTATRVKKAALTLIPWPCTG